MTGQLTQDEYEKWEPFSSAYARIGKAIGYNEARNEFRTRLAHGDLKAAARRATQTFEQHFDAAEFPILGVAPWSDIISDFDDIWKTSSHTFSINRLRYAPLEIACTGIRIASDGLEQILVDAGKSAAALVRTEASAPAEQVERKPIPKAEAERFATALLHAWPDASQDWAHGKLLLFYPEQQMSRDRFRLIFRAIQGEKRPGKPRKLDD